MRVKDQSAVRGILLCSYHLRNKLFAQTLFETESGFVQTHRLIADSHTTGNVDVPADSHQSDHAMTRLHAVCLLIESKAPCNRSRCCRCVHTGSSNNLLLGNTRNLRSLRRSHLFNALGKLFEAIAPVFDELLVVKPFGDDDVQPCHRKCRIGARTELQQIIRT